MLQEELNASRRNLASTAVDSAHVEIKSPAIISENFNFTESRIVDKPVAFGKLNTEDDEATQCFQSFKEKASTRTTAEFGLEQSPPRSPPKMHTQTLVHVSRAPIMEEEQPVRATMMASPAKEYRSPPKVARSPAKVARSPAKVASRSPTK